MVRDVCRCVGLLIAATVAAVWLAPAAQAQEPHPIVLLAKKLAKPVDFPGMDDPRATLRDVLEFLTERYGLRFDVNEKAFQMELGGGLGAMAPRAAAKDAFVSVANDQAAPAGKTPPGGKAAPPGKLVPPARPAQPNPPPGDVLNSPVTETKPIPKLTGVRLEAVLKRILARVPSPSGATYVLRRDGIEITTVEAKLAEFRVPADHAPALPQGLMDRGPPPDVSQLDIALVQAEFDKRPLDQALREIADATDSTVILDGRAADKAKAVTATLINVPLDTAVEILANMSGLQVVSRDRVLYVTTKDNADAMQKQMRDRVGGGPNGMPGFGPLPGGLGPQGPGVPGGPGFGPLPGGLGRPPGLGQLPGPGAPVPGADKGNF